MARRRPSRAARRVGIAAVMVAVVGGVSPLSPAPPASATHSSWGHPTSGGTTGSSIVCNAASKRVDISISAAVQTGYTGGQYIAWRYYFYGDSVGAFWSAWTVRGVPYNDYYQTTLLEASTGDGARSGNYYMYTEIMWWDGRSWSPARGQWAARGQGGFYFVNYHGQCYL